MTGAECKTYKEFVTARIEVALQRLHNNPMYMERRSKQNASEEVVENLFQKLNKEDRIAIRRHYEGETVRENFELDEAYLQGMRDCIQILSFLDVFRREVYFDE